MTRAEEIANDPRVTVAARIFMFVTPVIVIIGTGVITLTVNSQAAARTALENRVTAVESFDGAINSRVSVLESTSTTNKANRDKQLSDLAGRLDATQASATTDRLTVANKLDKIVDGMTQLSNQVAALSATIAASNRP
jgi:hypothetical protein